VVSPIDALRTAWSANVDVGTCGRDLLLDAPAKPPAAVLDALSYHKASILSALWATNDGWTPAERRALFDERAGIAEFDGGLTRFEAEQLAAMQVLQEMVHQKQLANGLSADDPLALSVK
jgi:hypothetical protein